MTAAQAFTELNAWQVMAWGLLFFGVLYTAGGWGMTALTRWLQRRGVGRVLDTRPLKPDQLRREWRQSLHSVLIFGIGMIVPWGLLQLGWARLEPDAGPWRIAIEIVDRKSTRLNSSHTVISYAVFCLKKKKHN